MYNTISSSHFLFTYVLEKKEACLLAFILGCHYITGWFWTQTPACLCLSNAGIKVCAPVAGMFSECLIKGWGYGSGLHSMNKAQGSIPGTNKIFLKTYVLMLTYMFLLLSYWV